MTPPSPRADDADLIALETAWLALLDERARDMRSVRRLAQRVMAVRSNLLARNAELQGTRDDADADAEIDANIGAIKRSTTLLNDMNLATGRASIPPEK